MEDGSPESVVIVGAGLSGLTAALHLLTLLPTLSITLLEARDRVGGRTDNVSPSLPFDVGGAWSWARSFPALTTLADKLGVDTFPQPGKSLKDVYDVGGDRPMRSPNDPQGRFRFKGGALALSHALRDRVTAAGAVIHTQCPVTAVSYSDSGVEVTCSAPSTASPATPGSGSGSGSGAGAGAGAADSTPSDRVFQAGAVIVAVPPRVVSLSIAFSPPLPATRAAAMADTPTWMSLTGKVIATYDAPFWATEDGLSGEAFSRVGPASQWYDASDVDAKQFGLCGFLFGDPAVQYATGDDTARRALESAVTDQLVRMFGPKAGSPESLHIKSWAGDVETTGETGNPTVSSHLMSHPHPNPALRPATGRVVWAGSETASSNAGLLDGAVSSGLRAAKDVAGILAPPRSTREL